MNSKLYIKKDDIFNIYINSIYLVNKLFKHAKQIEYSVIYLEPRERIIGRTKFRTDPKVISIFKNSIPTVLLHKKYVQLKIQRV